MAGCEFLQDYDQLSIHVFAINSSVSSFATDQFKCGTETWCVPEANAVNAYRGAGGNILSACFRGNV